MPHFIVTFWVDLRVRSRPFSELWRGVKHEEELVTAKTGRMEVRHSKPGLIPGARRPRRLNAKTNTRVDQHKDQRSRDQHKDQRGDRCLPAPHYRTKDVVQILDISRRQLQYWAQTDLDRFRR